MKKEDVTTGLEVVRSKGDYVVGRIGNVIAIDEAKERAQVNWKGETTTWVSFGSLEPTSKPYEIVAGVLNKKTGRHSFPKYKLK